MKKIALKVIEENYVNGSQSIELKGIYKLKDFKIKIHIDRDSYAAQSSAVISVWKASDLSWSSIASIHYSQMKVCGNGDSLSGVFYQRRVTELNYAEKALFTADKDHLVKLATEILF